MEKSLLMVFALCLLAGGTFAGRCDVHSEPSSCVLADCSWCNPNGFKGNYRVGSCIDPRPQPKDVKTFSPLHQALINGRLGNMGFCISPCEFRKDLKTCFAPSHVDLDLDSYSCNVCSERKGSKAYQISQVCTKPLSPKEAKTKKCAKVYKTYSEFTLDVQSRSVARLPKVEDSSDDTLYFDSDSGQVKTGELPKIEIASEHRAPFKEFLATRMRRQVKDLEDRLASLYRTDKCLHANICRASGILLRRMLQFAANAAVMLTYRMALEVDQYDTAVAAVHILQEDFLDFGPLIKDDDAALLMNEIKQASGAKPPVLHDSRVVEYVRDRMHMQVIDCFSFCPGGICEDIALQGMVIIPDVEKILDVIDNGNFREHMYFYKALSDAQGTDETGPYPMFKLLRFYEEQRMANSVAYQVMNRRTFISSRYLKTIDKRQAKIAMLREGIKASGVETRSSWTLGLMDKVFPGYAMDARLHEDWTNGVALNGPRGLTWEDSHKVVSSKKFPTIGSEFSKALDDGDTASYAKLRSFDPRHPSLDLNGEVFSSLPMSADEKKAFVVYMLIKVGHPTGGLTEEDIDDYFKVFSKKSPFGQGRNGKRATTTAPLGSDLLKGRVAASNGNVYRRGFGDKAKRLGYSLMTGPSGTADKIFRFMLLFNMNHLSKNNKKSKLAYQEAFTAMRLGMAGVFHDFGHHSIVEVFVVGNTYTAGNENLRFKLGDWSNMIPVSMEMDEKCRASRTLLNEKLYTAHHVWDPSHYWKRDDDRYYKQFLLENQF